MFRITSEILVSMLVIRAFFIVDVQTAHCFSYMFSPKLLIMFVNIDLNLYLY